MKKRKVISIRMDENMTSNLTRVAENNIISVGELCRKYIEGGLKNEQNKHKQKNRQKNL